MTAKELADWKEAVRREERLAPWKETWEIVRYCYTIAGYTYVIATTLNFISTLGL